MYCMKTRTLPQQTADSVWKEVTLPNTFPYRTPPQPSDLIKQSKLDGCTVWNEIFAVVYFLLGIFSVSRYFCVWVLWSKSVAWLWDGVLNFVIMLIVSLVCQILLNAGLNIRSIQLN